LNYKIESLFLRKFSVLKKSIIFILIGFFSLAKAQLTTINEDFNSFSQIGGFPQNNWEIATSNIYAIRIGIMSSGNRYVSVNGTDTNGSQAVNNPQYLFSPQIVAPDGTKSLSFDVYLTAQSTGATSIEIGLVSNPSDLSTYTSLGAPYLVQMMTPITLTYNIPNSSQQYIVFKFLTTVLNSQTVLDNVVYGNSNLSVNDTKNNSSLNFIVHENTLFFRGKNNVEEIEIYDVSGKVIDIGKIENNEKDISKLSSGIFFFQTRNSNGSVIKSKFIKR